jgi:hypothetical protein
MVKALMEQWVTRSWTGFFNPISRMHPNNLFSVGITLFGLAT